MRLQHTELAATNLSTDNPDRTVTTAAIVAEVKRLRWRIWKGQVPPPTPDRLLSFCLPRKEAGASVLLRLFLFRAGGQIRLGLLAACQTLLGLHPPRTAADIQQRLRLLNFVPFQPSLCPPAGLWFIGQPTLDPIDWSIPCPPRSCASKP
jgi:hypothetical protein